MVFRFIRVLCLVVCITPAFTAAQTTGPSVGPQSPDIHEIVERMMAAQQENKAHLRTFIVKRDYQVLDKQMERKAQVVANVTVVPPARSSTRLKATAAA